MVFEICDLLLLVGVVLFVLNLKLESRMNRLDAVDAEVLGTVRPPGEEPLVLPVGDDNTWKIRMNPGGHS